MRAEVCTIDRWQVSLLWYGFTGFRFIGVGEGSLLLPDPNLDMSLLIPAWRHPGPWRVAVAVASSVYLRIQANTTYEGAC